jgi:hypothetical protein
MKLEVIICNLLISIDKNQKYFDFLLTNLGFFSTGIGFCGFANVDSLFGKCLFEQCRGILTTLSLAECKTKNFEVILIIPETNVPAS